MGEIDRTLRKAKLPALFKEMTSFDDFVAPREGTKIPSPLPGDSNDVDDPADVMETEDPFEREEDSATNDLPPPTDVVSAEPLDAGIPADGQAPADHPRDDAADTEAANVADTPAPTSPGLSDLVDEDLLLLSDDDRIRGATQRGPE